MEQPKWNHLFWHYEKKAWHQGHLWWQIHLWVCANDGLVDTHAVISIDQWSDQVQGVQYCDNDHKYVLFPFHDLNHAHWNQKEDVKKNDSQQVPYHHNCEESLQSLFCFLLVRQGHKPCLEEATDSSAESVHEQQHMSHEVP